MNKCVMLFGVLLLVLIASESVQSAAECPAPSKVGDCSKKCKTDIDCTSSGKKCCRNACNEKSCAFADNNSGGKLGGGGSASSCGNVKCSAFERCGVDPQSKRPKCVRS